MKKRYTWSAFLVSITVFLFWKLLSFFYLTSYSREVWWEENSRDILGVEADFEEQDYININFLGSSVGKYQIETISPQNIVNSDFVKYFPSFSFANHKWKGTPVFVTYDMEKCLENGGSLGEEIKEKLESMGYYYAYKEGDIEGSIENLFLFDPEEKNFYFLSNFKK
ncbi:hypothetical protein [Flammeovirga sp. SJP92]|uniref:hypothetical protein n=1 Tax=Flammeovirga sp. SJP92 TaxID=1775430 RepID=UPI000788B4AA|nr:hypothetical protein [Flammeovirga sp. SJP92]